LSEKSNCSQGFKGRYVIDHMGTRFFRAVWVTICAFLAIKDSARIDAYHLRIDNAISRIVSPCSRTVRPKSEDTKFHRSFVTMTPFSCVIMGEFLFARKLFRKRWLSFAHWHSPFAHWHSVRTATLPKQGSLSTDCSRIDMTMRAKTRKGTASAILMRALLCNRVPVRKQEPLTVIPMRALFQWWKTTHSHCAHWNLICIPVCESYVCPFLCGEWEICFLLIRKLKENESQTMRAKEPKWPKRVIFRHCAYGDSIKMRLWVSQCADKSCAHIVYYIYVPFYFFLNW
jgi:hypothetical protein